MQGGASSVSLPVLALQRDVRGSKWLSWLCFNVTLFLVGSAVIAPAVTTYAFAPALRLSSLQVSMLASAPLLGTAVLSIPVTLGARSLGGQLVALLLSCAVGVAMLVLAGVFQWLPLQGAGYIYPLLVVLALALGSGTATVNCGLIQCWWWAERYQGRVVGALLFSTSAGPAVFGAIAEPLVTAIGLSGLYLLWALLALSCAVLLLLLGHDPPYVQLLRAARRAQLAVEPLPPLPAGFVPREHCLRQDDIKAVAYAVWAQDIFPTRTLRADLWLSLSSARSWCVIVMADVTLGCFLGFIVWIPVFCVNVFRVSSFDAGLMVLGFGLAGAVGSAVAGPLIDLTNVWAATVVFFIATICGFVVIAASPYWALTVVAIVSTGVAVLAANTACYKLVITETPDCAAGAICFMEVGADLIAFALPLVFAAIFDSSGSSDGLRIALALPCGLLVLCVVPFVALYRLHRPPAPHLISYRSGLLDVAAVANQ